MPGTQARMIYLHALTPVHVGTGQAVAVVDLPIAREKATGWPMIPASSLKGVLRDRVDGQAAEDIFGTPERAGKLWFGDQRIFCLPVRSYYGTFAFVTCPLILERLIRDYRAFGLELPFSGRVPEVDDGEALLPQTTRLARNNKVYLEDLELQAKTDQPAVSNMADAFARLLFSDNPALFSSRLAVVSDEVFNFLSETATQVVARVRLGETKTVDRGALWYEEAVPAESLFSGPVLLADHVRGDIGEILRRLGDGVVQIGGNATVGYGLCRMVIAP